MINTSGTAISHAHHNHTSKGEEDMEGTSPDGRTEKTDEGNIHSV